jgi:hypothetical protein
LKKKNKQLDSRISTTHHLESWNSANLLLGKIYSAVYFFMGAAGIQTDRTTTTKSRLESRIPEKEILVQNYSHSDDDPHLKSWIPTPLPLRRKTKQIAWNPGNQVSTTPLPQPFYK